MATLDHNKQIAILQVLHESNSFISSGEIASALHAQGYETSARTVRHYLQKMQTQGLVQETMRGRRSGTRILPKGVRELHASRTIERVGFMQANIDQLAYRMDFNLESGEGNIVLNVTLIKASALSAALREIKSVYKAGLGMGRYLAVFPPGIFYGKASVPEDCVGIGTICSVTVNGILLKAGIPTISRYGGILEVEGTKPLRFTELIAYGGTTLDPLEIFIKARLTRIRQTVSTGRGHIGASFREIPTNATHRVRELQSRMDEIGLGGLLFLGPPNRAFLDIPITENKTGMIVIGGLNPAAAIEEAGFATASRALSMLYDFGDLIPCEEVENHCKEKGLL